MHNSKVLFIVPSNRTNQNGKTIGGYKLFIQEISNSHKNKEKHGIYELPGGKIKTNEIPERALCRELFEELGINIKINDLLPLTFVSYPYPSFNLLMLVYICKKWKGNFLLKENQKINFYKKQELIGIDMLEADKSLIEPLREILS